MRKGIIAQKPVKGIIPGGGKESGKIKVKERKKKEGRMKTLEKKAEKDKEKNNNWRKR